jgi:hypothetical protein
MARLLGANTVLAGYIFTRVAFLELGQDDGLRFIIG